MVKIHNRQRSSKVVGGRQNSYNFFCKLQITIDGGDGDYNDDDDNDDSDNDED